jgi:hypothetical protein
LALWWHDEIEWRGISDTTSINTQYSLDEFHGDSDNYCDFDVIINLENASANGKFVNQYEVCRNTNTMIILAVFLLIISLILSIASIFVWKIGKITTIFLISALIVTIIIPIYFAVEFPKATNKDYDDHITLAVEHGVHQEFLTDSKPTNFQRFAGILEKDKYIRTWEPLIGWYMQLGVIVFTGLCAIFSFFPARKPLEAGVIIHENMQDDIKRQLN